MCSSLELVVGSGVSYWDVLGICLHGIFGLVERTPCIDWTMCTFMVSSADGQYAVALDRVRQGQVRKLRTLMALSHVVLAGNPAATRKYRTKASTLGKS